ncbi:hypothetical protein ES703_10022 [subsurface metagenome]
MAIGEFGAILDSVIFPQVESRPPNLRKRTKNVALLLTQHQTSGYKFFRSIAIDDAGNIDDTPIDTMAIETWTHRDMGLIHWINDVFAAYSNDDAGAGHLHTVGCDQDGVITDAPLDYLEVGTATNYSRRTQLIKPHDGILLTGPCKPSAGVHLQTVPITDAGFMPDTVTDSLALPVQPYVQRLRQGAGNRIIDLVGVSGGYHIYSFTCTSAGDLPDSPDDSWGLIPCATYCSSLCKISDTVFAIFTRDLDNTGQIHTFSINPDGTINKTFIDDEQVDPLSYGQGHMTEMGAGYFVLADTMTGPTRRLKTYFIADDGEIQDGAIDSLDGIVSFKGNQRFEHLQGNIWTLTYENAPASVRIDTIEIDTPSNDSPHTELTVGIGP